MKSIYTIGIAVLFGIVVAWWLIESEAETNATPVPAVSSDFDASRQMGGTVETLQQQGSQQQVTPSRESAAGRDVGSGSAMAVPAGQVALSAPASAQVNLSASGTEQVALRNATETSSAQPADSKSSEPSAIDKTDCEAAAKTLDESLSIFDVTPTLAVWYAWSPPYPNAGPTGFDWLKARLLPPLCSGTTAFDQTYPAKFEFVAISMDSHVRILVGDNWISDGTVLSPMSESDHQLLANALAGRRLQGIGSGRNTSRESFERTLARNPRWLIVGQ
ncbi:MAG: hypothetical protein IAF94_18295 [Pirellulaceae bacterium]|nr:hypothetical protein [Pirellulaceae bacterium]